MKRRQTEEFFRFVCLFTLSQEIHSNTSSGFCCCTREIPFTLGNSRAFPKERGCWWHLRSLCTLWDPACTCACTFSLGPWRTKGNKYSCFTTEEGAASGWAGLRSSGAWRWELEAGPCGGFRRSLCFGSGLYPHWCGTRHSAWNLLPENAPQTYRLSTLCTGVCCFRHPNSYLFFPYSSLLKYNLYITKFTSYFRCIVWRVFKTIYSVACTRYEIPIISTHLAKISNTPLCFLNHLVEFKSGIIQANW